MINAFECVGRKAENPFYLDKIELRIYSADELIYCICENPELIDKAMFTEELFEWLDMECNAKSLANRVYKLCCQGGNLLNCIKGILEDAGYISNEEMHFVLNVIDKMRGNNESGKHKVRAEFFLRKRRYSQAINELNILINNSNPNERALLAEHYHNMGIAKAGMFLFEQAGEDFLKAYSYDNNPEHYYAYAATLKFRLSDMEYINEVAANPILRQVSLELEEKWQSAVSAWQSEDLYREFVEKKASSELEGKQPFYDWVKEKVTLEKEGYRRLVL